MTDDLVWVGAPGGDAHRRTPLPIAVGGKNCRFRPVVMEALRSAGRDWRILLQVANQDAVNATVAAGLSVTALLRETVPPNLEVLGPSSGLPPLPAFKVNLFLPATGGSDIARELARHIRAEFATRSERASAPRTKPEIAPRQSVTKLMRRVGRRSGALARARTAN